MARKLQRRMCWRKPPKTNQAASTKLAEKPREILSFQVPDFAMPFVYFPVFGIRMLKNGWWTNPNCTSTLWLYLKGKRRSIPDWVSVPTLSPTSFVIERKTEMEIIEARQRAQIKGGKMLTILKGEMLKSRSFVHLKPSCQSEVKEVSWYCQAPAPIKVLCIYVHSKVSGLNVSPVVFVVADPRAAVHNPVVVSIAEIGASETKVSLTFCSF